MLGEGIVSFGVPLPTTDFRKSKWSPKMQPFSPSLPVTRRPDGVKSTSPWSLWKCTVMFCSTFCTPPIWYMKSMCQDERRNSPSVMPCRPMSSCIFTTARIASSSIAFSCAAPMRPCLCSSRARSSSFGRSRLPT